MKILIEISSGYWRNNKKRFFQILVVLIMSMAGLVAACFYGRSAMLLQLQSWLNNRGNFDISVYYPNEEIDDYLMNDDRYSEKTKVIRIGKTEFENRDIEIGYFEDKQAEDMFHVKLIKGRFPKGEDEICIDELLLKEIGYSPEINQTINLNIKTNEEEQVTRTFKIVGIIEMRTQSEYGTFYVRSNFDKFGQVYYPPLIYLSKDTAYEICNNTDDYIFLGNVKYTDKFDDFSMLYELNSRFDQIVSSDTEYNFSRSQIIAAITMRDNAYLREGIGFNSNDKYVGSNLMQKDYYNGVLIPLFFFVFVLITLLSLYSVFKVSLIDRYKEISMLRCIGMDMKQLILMLFGEMIFFMLSGIIGGFIFGILIYVTTLSIQNKIFGQEILWAFNFDEFWGKYISIVTHNPYVLPALIIILVLFVVFFFYVIQNLREESPVNVVRKNLYKHCYKTVESSLMGGVHLMLIFMLVFTLLATLYAYFSIKTLAKENNAELQDLIESVGTDNFDFVVTLDVNDTLLGSNQLLHNAGINAKDFEIIKNDSNVKSVIGYIANLSTKVVLNRKDERNMILQTGNCRYDEIDGLSEEDNEHIKKVDDKDWKYKGYSDDENLYQVPMFGFSSDNIEMFTKNIITNGYDANKIMSGEEVILVVDDKDKIDYFSVGEEIEMTDVVFESSIDTNELITQGIAPGDMEVSEYIDGIPFYAIGNRKDFKVKIGAIAFVDDDLAKMIWRDYPLPNSGLRIVTIMDAFGKIGLPDTNITDLYVELNDCANHTDFEGKWYYIVSNSYKMKSFDMKKLKTNIIEKEKSTMMIFYALYFVFIIIVIVCLYNFIAVIVQNARGKINILKNIGATKNNIYFMFCSRMLRYPVLAGMLSLVICVSYIKLVKIALDMRENNIITGDHKNDKTWFNMIPCLSIEGYNPFFMIFVFSVIVSVIVLFITIRVVKKNSILSKGIN